MLEPSARVIADSLSPDGVRLTTLEVRMHRFVLAEFNTHRVFSRNSASSRAIPVHKQIAMLESSPAVPLEWGTNKAGMQAGPPLTGAQASEAESVWLAARDQAVAAAEALRELGVHKQVTNRLLEPFMAHTVIVTSTEWDGFFAQRINSGAQPEIQAAATAMQSAMETSTPEMREHGTWHLPYLQDDELELDLGTKIQVSIARCARVSYLNHDGQRSLEDDLKLYRRLVSVEPMHASPLEHVARPLLNDESALGNFRGWRQFRHLIESPDLTGGVNFG